MLGQMIGDRPHAFGDRLVLRVDAVDAGVIAAGACASRSISQSFWGRPLSRQRPCQWVLFGR